MIGTQLLHLFWPQPHFLVVTQAASGCRSSTEAECCSLAYVTTELLWLQTLLTELSVPFTATTAFYDNQSVVLVVHNPILHARTKNMEIDLFFVREKVLAKKLIVKHITFPVMTNGQIFLPSRFPVPSFFPYHPSSMWRQLLSVNNAHELAGEYIRVYLASSL
jgi:hypothetical protein